MHTCSTDVCHLYSVHLCSLWLCVGYMFMFWGDVYLCRNGFFIEVQKLAEKHHLICGPQRPVPGLVASESPGTLLKINSLRAHLDRLNLQEQGLGIWILTCAAGNLILVQSRV